MLGVHVTVVLTGSCKKGTIGNTLLDKGDLNQKWNLPYSHVGDRYAQHLP